MTMKNIFQYCLFILFAITGLAAKAQDTDSIYRAKKVKDSVYRALRKDYEAKDSIYHFDHNKKKSLRIDSLHSIYELRDSIYRKTQKGYRLQSDSLRKLYTSHVIMDSLHKYKIAYGVRLDSLHRIEKFKRVQSDSLRKLYSSHVIMDSLHKYKIAYGVRLDSVKRKLFLRNIKSDSMRLKKYLQHKKMELQKFQDTITLRDGYRSRQLSMEISCFDGDTVYINNNNKKVVINIAPHQRLKLSTALVYKRAMDEQDPVILKRMGIEFNRTATRVTTNINGAKDNEYKNKLLQNEMSEAEYNELNSEANVKQTLFVEVPGNAVLFLNTSYAESCIAGYVKNIHVEIRSGTLKMGNADNAVIKTRYSTIIADDIKDAALELINTKFTASNIHTMSVVSTSSSIQLNNCSTMKMASISDDYKMENAGTISGSKDFGKLNIETLQDRLELKGANTDLKIKNFSYEAPFIKIDSKYADLKLPLYDQKNYSIYYEGSYGDVNRLSSSIKKINDPATKAFLYVQNDTVAVGGGKPVAHKTKYEATAGDITGKHAKVDIVCPFCNVVFN
jgi:hypothetical protein